MSESKEESNSTTSDVKEEEENSPKPEEAKVVDESSKDSEKDSVKEDSVKEESGKEGSDKDESEDDSEEEGMGLLDRPVEVTGCRARKKVERLEVSFATPKEKIQGIPEGKGKKLGECPRIEFQIQKTSNNDLKPLHRILFNRVGGANEIKRNIRKFSGFPFGKNSPEFERKKAQVEKLTGPVLKQMCAVLDIERGGLKEEVVNRFLEFLLEPRDSGKDVKPKKKAANKEKKKSSGKKNKNNKAKSEIDISSDEPESASDKDSVKEKEDGDSSDESDFESKKKSKNAKKTPSKVTTKKAEKKEKPKKEEKKGLAKGSKRKRDVDSDESSEDEPAAKKSKVPSDDEIKKLVKRILDAADLQEITMKKVIKQVADAYPDCDLSHKKAFIKTTIKSVIS